MSCTTEYGVIELEEMGICLFPGGSNVFLEGEFGVRVDSTVSDSGAGKMIWP
jgi:hypothetical protein